MKFDIITIFPRIFDSYFNESIICRAQEKKLIEINVHNLRDYTDDAHKTAAPACATRKRFGRVDDKPFGGGPGMIFKVEPVFRAVEEMCKKKKSLFCHSGLDPESIILDSRWSLPRSGIRGGNDRKEKGKRKICRRVILFSAKGKQFTQADARRLAKYDQLILICGRYEGVDERVVEHIVDEEISIGEYVLTGGEIPAMIVVDAVSRLIPGVLGKKESLKEESFALISSKQLTVNRKSRYLEYPQYTRPENFRGWKAPKVLLSGNHKKIKEWREKHSKAEL